MKISSTIKGSFGGGGSKTTTTSSPTESDDTLQCSQTAWIIDAISEGPIGGLCDRNWNIIANGQYWGMGIFYDATQLMTDSGQFNFNGVQIGAQNGYDNQAAFTNFVTAGDTVSVGVQIFHNQPYTISIEDPNTTRVALGIRYPALEQQDNKGNVGPYQVTIYLFISLNGGPMASLHFQGFTLKGKCTSDFTKEYNITLPRSPNPQQDYWQIQVQRASADDADSRHHSTTIFDYYTRIVDANLIYPGTAYVVQGIDSKTLSTIPSRGFRIKGKLIQIPTNYFADTRRYTRDYTTGADTGVELPWNGTFYTTWSNNPAWVFYDMATNSRYGAGGFIGSNIDIWALYEIAQYCDEWVPDGIGGLEPRFTLNTYIQTQAQAWKVLSDIASCFRGLLYWGGGTVVPVQDRPKPMIQVFTNANVVGAMFSYADTEIKNRQSDATVTWNDSADFFNQKLERVTNQEARVRFGTREVQFAAFGCTSRGQANRAGKYLLETNLVETETVVFQAGLEAMYLRPGDIIGIADNDRIGTRRGGRVVSIGPLFGNAGGTYVTLDMFLPAQPDATLIWFYASQSAQLASDVPVGNVYASEIAQSNHPPQVQVGVIYFMNGMTNNVVYVQPFASDAFPPVGSAAAAYPIDQETTEIGYGLWQPLSLSVQPGSIWVLSNNLNTPLDLPLATFRIIDIVEKEQHVLQITAVTYEEGKYNEIDFGYQFELPLLTAIPPVTSVLAPNNPTAIMTDTVTNEAVTLFVELNWEAPPDPTVRSYRVYQQYGTGTFIFVGEVASTSITLPTPTPGTYTYRIYSSNYVAVLSAPATVAIVVPDVRVLFGPRISGLELRGQGNDNIFHSLDATIDWRLNSPYRSFEFNSEEPYGANTGSYDPYFTNFTISVYDANTNILGWKDNTTDLTYTILYSKNTTAWGDGLPRNRLTVYVQANNAYNVPTPQEYLTIDNPPPPPARFLTAIPGESRATLQWIVEYAIDLVKINIYQSLTGLLKDAFLINTTSSHADSFTTAPLGGPGTYYFTIAQLDTFGTESNKVALVSVTTT